MQRCEGGNQSEIMEACFWESLQVIRRVLEGNKALVAMIVERLKAARERLEQRQRKPRSNGPGC